MTMCNVCLKIALGQVRSMTAGNSVFGATKRTDEHRAECCLLNAHNALTAAAIKSATPVSLSISAWLQCHRHNKPNKQKPQHSI